MTKRWVRLAAIVLTVVLMAAAVPSATTADSVSDLRARKKALAEEIESLEAEKDALSDDLSSQQAKRDKIEKQIELKEQEIAVNNSLIAELDGQIAEKDYEIAQQEQAITDTETAIETRFHTLKERLRAVSKTGNMSVLQMLFDTDNYLDYLLKSKLMERISDYDRSLMKEMEKQIAELNKQKAKLEADKKEIGAQRAEIEAIRAAADADREELEALYSEVQSLMYDIQSDIDEHDEQIARTAEQEAALEAEIEDILARSHDVNNGQAYKGGSMYWPSTSCTLITDVFGWRILAGESNMHKGIDIACPGSAYGRDIIAAQDGVVIYANSSDSWGSGYGYYVMVDHGLDSAGQRIVTLYAHCSAVYVYDGQEVVGGETQIGAIGSTGWSYGSHLHFEVRVDGSPVNPLAGYVSAP